MRNTAAELGPSTFKWWQDWRGKSVAIIASGPSTKKTKLELLRGKILVLAIKENAFELCPWADVVYGCDGPWWIHRKGLPDFKGVRLAWDAKALSRFPEINQIRIDRTKDEILVDEPGVIGAGLNSGFHALNIAVQFGAERILLIGYDMQEQNATHWYGRNHWNGANNACGYNFKPWVAHLENASHRLRDLGVEVFNASPTTALRSYPKITVEEFASWGLEISSSRQDSRKGQRLEASA